MKPKDLKAPYTWQDRRPLLQDGIFHLPDRYEHHHLFSFPSWKELFGNDNPIKLEFCSGNGKWIVEKAQKERDVNWIAVEWDYERVRKIWSKQKNEALTNLFIISGEAFTFASHYVRANSLSEIFINFPDPWPKRKHEKHRLLSPLFISQLAKMLVPKAAVTFVTDDKPYLEWTLKHFLSDSSFTPKHPTPHTTTISNYGTSYFEELWRSHGKEIFFLEMVKR